MNRILASSRYLAVVAAIVALASAVLLLGFAVVYFVEIVRHVTRLEAVNAVELRELVGELIELTDVLLLSTVFYVVAVGLYELFVHPLPVPAWLKVHSLDDLKELLAAVVIVVLGVSFLGEVVIWDSERDLQGFGLAIAAVVAALTYFLSKRERHE